MTMIYEAWRISFQDSEQAARAAYAAAVKHSAECEALAARAEQANNAFVAAINHALNTDEGLTFLRCWNEGDFDAIRQEWPDTPEAVFIGADPTHPLTKCVLRIAAGGNA